jgi:hypothetical protein
MLVNYLGVAQCKKDVRSRGFVGQISALDLYDAEARLKDGLKK